MKKTFPVQKWAIEAGGEHVLGLKDLGTHACYLIYGELAPGEAGRKVCPGAGHEEISQWYELIRHILARGKSVQVFARLNEIDNLVKNVGAKGLLIHTRVSSPQEAEALLKQYPQVV